ncbi:hypothetical protein BGZ73_002249 [Actinomortierella ambigua]|nr:hypothetical protein BGZ73_002249 [Actinomortierella ambigua]
MNYPEPETPTRTSDDYTSPPYTSDVETSEPSTTEPPWITTTTTHVPPTETTTYKPSTTTDPYVRPTATTTEYVPPPPPATTTTTRRRTKTHRTSFPPTTTAPSSTDHPPSSSQIGSITDTSIAPKPSSNPDDSVTGMSTGGIVGVVVGSLAALTLLLGLVFLGYRRHKRKRGEISFDPIMPGMQERPVTGGATHVGAAGLGAGGATGKGSGGGGHGGMGGYGGRESIEPLGHGYSQSGISSATDTTHAASAMTAAGAGAGAAGAAAFATGAALMSSGSRRDGRDNGLRPLPSLPPSNGGDMDQEYYQDGRYSMPMGDPRGVHYQPPVGGGGYGPGQYDPTYAARVHQQQQQLLDEAAYAQQQQQLSRQQGYPNQYPADVYGGLYDSAAAAARYGDGRYLHAEGLQYPDEYYSGGHGYHHGEYPPTTQPMYYDPTTSSPSVAPSSATSSTRVLQPPLVPSSSAPTVPTSSALGYAYPESDARWSKETAVSPPSMTQSVDGRVRAGGVIGRAMTNPSGMRAPPGSAVAAQSFQGHNSAPSSHPASQQQTPQTSPLPTEARPSGGGSAGIGVASAGTGAASAAGERGDVVYDANSPTSFQGGGAGIRSSIISVKSSGSGSGGTSTTRSPQRVDPQSQVILGSPSSHSDVEEQDLRHLQSLRSYLPVDESPRNPQAIVPKDPQQGATGEDYSGNTVVQSEPDVGYKVPVHDDGGLLGPGPSE